MSSFVPSLNNKADWFALFVCLVTIPLCIGLLKNSGYYGIVFYPLILLISSSVVPLISKIAGFFHNALFVCSLYFIQYFVLTNIGYDSIEFAILVIIPLVISLTIVLVQHHRRSKNRLG